MSLWPPGLRGKAIRLANDAGLNVKDPIANSAVEMVVQAAKFTKRHMGPAPRGDWQIVSQSARLLIENPTARPLLIERFPGQEAAVDTVLGELKRQGDAVHMALSGVSP